MIKNIDSKKRLGMILSKLKPPKDLKIELEQYITPSEEASNILWSVRNEISEKVLADFGCGHGVLGIGALLLGAKKVFFIEIDSEMIEVLKINLKKFNEKSYEIINDDIKNFEKKVDLIIMNPPFGTHNKGFDSYFIKNALKATDKVYSLLSALSKDWLMKSKSNFNHSIVMEFDLALKRSKTFHTKMVKKFRVIFVKFWN